jgi:hypothetical protein
MNYFYYTNGYITQTVSNNYTYTPNRVIQFQGEYYCYHDGDVYARGEDCNWGKIPLNELPEQITITKSGTFWIKETLASDKLEQGEYIGDVVEEPTSTCLCPMQTLMSLGCKCGGE